MARRDLGSRLARGLAVASGVALLAAPAPVPAPAAVAPPTATVLLASGEVRWVRLQSGAVEAVTLIPGSDFGSPGNGPYLARAGPATVVAVPGPRGRVVTIAQQGAEPRTIYEVGGGRVLRALLRTPTGELVLVANDRPGALVVELLAADGRRLSERIVKPAAGTVHSASLSADGRTLAVAYHGDAEGFDLVDTATLTLTCVEAGIGGCVMAHGSLRYAGNRLFSSTGGPQVGELVPGTATMRRRAVRLRGNHMLELAGPGRDGRYLYVVGACGYTGGVSRIDLRNGGVRVLARASREVGLRGPCGTQAALLGDANDEVLAIAANPGATARRAVPARLLAVDPATGSVRRSVRLRSGIVGIADAP